MQDRFPTPKLAMDITKGGFDKFLADGGGIDFRLDEQCWKPLDIGDFFEFVEDPGEQRRYLVEIVEKFTAPTFSALIDELPASLFDISKKQAYLDFFAEWWSSDDESKDGVLGLHIKVVEGSLCESD